MLVGPVLPPVPVPEDDELPGKEAVGTGVPVDSGLSEQDRWRSVEGYNKRCTYHQALVNQKHSMYPWSKYRVNTRIALQILMIGSR